MKKWKGKMIIIFILSAVTISFSLSACAGCNNTVTPVENTPTAVVTDEVTKALEVTTVPTVEQTVEPSVTEKATPTESLSVTATPELTEIPTPTEEAAPAPTEEVIPTEVPTPTPEPTNTPIPTDIPTPVPTSTPVPTATPTPKPTATPKPTVTPTPVPVKGIVAGDYVTFGSYEQDNDLTNGKEPIEWLVLDTKDGKAFLLSKYVLDAIPFDTTVSWDLWMTEDESFMNYRCTWEKSTIRTWLNGDFYNSVFTQTEKKSIVLTDVENLPLHIHDMVWSCGPDTKDRIFLLSESEAIQYFGEEYVCLLDENKYIWMYGNLPERTEHLGVPTKYAVERGVNTDPIAGLPWTEGYCKFWWLRTTAWNNALAIKSSGFLEREGCFPQNELTGVRPCLWIDVETADVEKVK